MAFNSYDFLLFVTVVYLLYYFLARQWQVWALLFAGLFFYGYAHPWLLILLFISASANAVFSYSVYHETSSARRYLYTFIGVVFNLGILASFKYNKLMGEFVSETFIRGHSLLKTLYHLPLPIGISFYTFHGISLILDSGNPENKGRLQIDKSFPRHYLNTFLFINFFPQLVAGPLIKAHNFFPQIGRKLHREIDFEYVFRNLIAGFFLKCVIADNLKDQTFWITYPYFEFMGSGTLLFLLFGYSMQIFADFAGYSLIAIGFAALLGYKLPTNFNFPYISTSITEFWQRWHISLSSWLKEYLYFNLGGNRKGRVRTYINLIIVMFLGGLWHGAALSYGVWGLWHGIGLAIERAISGRKRGNAERNAFPVAALKMAFVFCFVSVGWLFFKLTDFSEATLYLKAIYNNRHISTNRQLVATVLTYSAPVILYHFYYLAKEYRATWLDLAGRNEYLAYGTMLFFLVVNRGIPGDFVYFQF